MVLFYALLNFITSYLCDQHTLAKQYGACTLKSYTLFEKNVLNAVLFFSCAVLFTVFSLYPTGSRPYQNRQKGSSCNYWKILHEAHPWLPQQQESLRGNRTYSLKETPKPNRWVSCSCCKCENSCFSS